MYKKMSKIFDKKNRNFAYYKLVQSDDDYVGMVAYTIYKKSKIAYIQELRSDQNRTEDEIDSSLETWQQSKCNDSEIKTLRDNAVAHVAEFTTKLIEQKDKELFEKEKKLNKRESKIEKKEAQLKSQKYFWYGVKQSIVGSFVYMVITILVYLGLNLNGNLTDLIINYFTKK